MKKLAMIGCGGIGRYHLGHFVNFKDIELAGFCDLLIERAEEFVQIAGSGKAYSDFVKMYDEVKPDMVFICIPPSTHGYIEFETIRRGIPFFVEKPVALDMSLANAINDEITKKNLITAVGFQCRYDDINVAAKNFIDSNKIVTVAASRVGGIPEVNWWRIKSLSGLRRDRTQRRRKQRRALSHIRHDRRRTRRDHGNLRKAQPASLEHINLPLGRKNGAGNRGINEILRKTARNAAQIREAPRRARNSHSSRRNDGRNFA